MTPADIARHTAETRELLKDASYKRIDATKGGFNPYDGHSETPPNTIGSMTFVWAFSWTPEIEPNRAGWEQLIQGFKLALSVIYPDCGVISTDVKVEKSRQFPMALAQIYAKTRRAVRGPLVILEADVVCIKRCDPFEAEFDIGLTDCQDQWPMMPFNAGVMFARDTPNAQRFLDTAMEYACNIPQNCDPWYAYQFALSHTYLALKDEVRIKVFPHEEYNHTPTVYSPTDAYFVHLKGDRKAIQRDYVLPLLEGQRGRLVVAPPC